MDDQPSNPIAITTTPATVPVPSPAVVPDAAPVSVVAPTADVAQAKVEPLIPVSAADQVPNFTPPPLAVTQTPPSTPATNEAMASQIETLSADIKTIQNQAAPTPIAEAASQPPAPDVPVVTSPAVPKDVAPIAKPSFAPPPPPTIIGANSTSSGMRDITPPGEPVVKEKPVVEPPPLPNAAPKSTEPSISATAATMAKKETTTTKLGSIGQVVSLIGIFLLALLLVSPFYRGALSTSPYNTLSGIGWLVSLVFMAIGLLVLLFAKGEWLMKSLLIILLVVGIVFYLGLSSPSSIFGTSLSSILTYYK